MPFPLVAVGALNVDLVFRLTGPVRERASNVATLERRVGGVAANVARSYAAERDAALASGATRPAPDGPVLACAVGDDLVPPCAGVELLAVTRPGAAGSTYAAVLDAGGELRLGLAATDVVETLTAEEVRARLGGRRAGAWLVDANLSAACLAGLAERAASVRGPGDGPDGSSAAPFAAMAVSPEKALRLAPLASLVDCLFCNRREAAALTGAGTDAPLATLARALRDLGWRRAVLTDGPAPLAVVEPDGTTVLDVPPAPAPGPAPDAPGPDDGPGVNGAGDALAGATLVHWLAGAPLADAVARAGLPAAARHLDPTRSPRP